LFLTNETISVENVNEGDTNWTLENTVKRSRTKGEDKEGQGRKEKIKTSRR